MYVILHAFGERRRVPLSVKGACGVPTVDRFRRYWRRRADS